MPLLRAFLSESCQRIPVLCSKVEALGLSKVKQMNFLKRVLTKLKGQTDMDRIQHALALPGRGGVLHDDLTLSKTSCRLEIEWRARNIHPWDRDLPEAEQELTFAEQSLADTDAAVSRLFKELPEVESIEFRVIHPESDQRILAGTVERSAFVAKIPAARINGTSTRTKLWLRGVTITVLVATSLVLVTSSGRMTATTSNSKDLSLWHAATGIF